MGGLKSRTLSPRCARAIPRSLVRWISHRGLVEKTLSLSLADLRAVPATEEYVTMECISNNVGGEQISTGKFKGVALRDLLTMAGPQSQGGWVAFKARDGYTESIPRSLVEGEPEVLVVYELEGAPLPMNHGFPARVLIPGHYGMKGPKWLDSIDLVNQESRGYWEQQGWDHNAVVKTTARFDVPGDGEIVKVGAVQVAGVAFAGTRGMSKVEYSTNGGSSWTGIGTVSASSALLLDDSNLVRIIGSGNS